MGVFDHCQITLDLDSSIRFKAKLELKKKVTENGGIISFIVTNKVLISSYSLVLSFGARVRPRVIS